MLETWRWYEYGTRWCEAPLTFEFLFIFVLAVPSILKGLCKHYDMVLFKKRMWLGFFGFMYGFVGFSSISVEGPTSVFRLAIDLSLKASSSNVLTCVYYYLLWTYLSYPLKKRVSWKEKICKRKTKQKKRQKIKKNGWPRQSSNLLIPNPIFFNIIYRK